MNSNQNKIQQLINNRFNQNCGCFMQIGPTGPTGAIGEDGLQGPQGEIGPTGPKGDTGPQGDVGPPVSINIGTVETTDSDTMASVVDTGSGSVHILNFTIPRGTQGIEGPAGPMGPAGTSVTILGSYDDISDLKKDHPKGSPGQSYLVEDNLYVWSDTLGDWQDVGVIRGPQGIPGEPGPIGPVGPRGMQGLPGIQGEKGEMGPTGATETYKSVSK